MQKEFMEITLFSGLKKKNADDKQIQKTGI